MTSIGDHIAGRDNNLNLMRMVAASAVLISHAYPIALGPGTIEPLEPLLGVTLGTVAVYIFFAISGFLIARSYDRSRTLAAWGVARVLRLFPGLFVVLVLSVLVLGPSVTTYPPGRYFTDPATLSYVPRNLSLAALQYELPGVFAGNPYGGAINGSLWTLVHEVVCYLGVLAIGLLGVMGSRRRMLGIVCLYAAGVAAVLVWQDAAWMPVKLVQLADLSQPFVAGTALYVWRDRVPLNWATGAGLAALAALAALFSAPAAFHTVFVVALSYWVFLLAWLPGGLIRRYNALGDYSYGIYVYAFPMQQLMAHLAGPQSPGGNIALAAPATLALAVLSWHFVEKPAMAARHRVVRMLERRGTGEAATGAGRQATPGREFSGPDSN